jgi:hypothetical protein
MSNRSTAGMRIGAIAAAVAGALAASLPLEAHHSFAAEFDSTREVRITGAVSEVEWQNPHAWIHLAVTEVCERQAARGRGRGGGGGGESEEASFECRTPAADEAAWAFELGSPNGLMRQGWNRNSLNNGDAVTVEGTRARDGSTNANARNVTMADGTRLFAGSSEGVTP